MYKRVKWLTFFLCAFFSFGSMAQDGSTDSTHYRTMAANADLAKKSSSFKKKWGANRRLEWATPLTVPVLYLDKQYGGLIPKKTGGGNETKSLQLQSLNGKEYSLRSVNKSRDDVIPPGFEQTFLEDIIRDGVSQSHPYAALALAGMQEAAGIYHPEPMLVYLPRQAALDTFNMKYGDDLYFLEQRPDGDWSEAPNLGNFKEFTDTEQVLEKLLENNLNKADQFAFVKARLFDMLIGDWDMHEGNWKWGIADSAGIKRFVPIPRDRDQAFYTHNGVLIDKFLPLSGLSFMQHFDYETKDINPLNKAAGNMDRFFTNALEEGDWIRAAQQLQHSLTDTVITGSVRQLPKEIFAVSGNELIAKLKARRKSLVQYATSVYRKVSAEVEIIGSRQKEYFHITRDTTGNVMAHLYRYKNTGEKEEVPFYSRSFKPSETKELRLFGIGGEDLYQITGDDRIRIRIIGGPDKDSIVQEGSRIYIYDSRDNVFQTNKVSLHLSPDSSIHIYNYKERRINNNGFIPDAYYNNTDRFFVGIRYRYKNPRWRRGSLPVEHTIGVRYSISQNAMSASYTGLKSSLNKKTNFLFHTDYDAIRWTNFYGLGNESKLDTDDIWYYRMLSSEWLASFIVRHRSGKNFFELSPFFLHANIKNDSGKFVSSIFQPAYPEATFPKNYAGLRLGYRYISLNNPIVPTKGINVNVNGKLVRNTTDEDFFQNYGFKAKLYLPIGGKFSMSFNIGGETILGNTEVLKSAQLYQHAVIGGPESLRGYRIERFWGKSSFYNNNELRYITNLRTYLLNAKVGFLAFFDDGRVWLPGEDSNHFHTSYGAGILLAPFNKFCIQVTYGASSEAKLVQLKFNTPLL